MLTNLFPEKSWHDCERTQVDQLKATERSSYLVSQEPFYDIDHNHVWLCNIASEHLAKIIAHAVIENGYQWKNDM